MMSEATLYLFTVQCKKKMQKYVEIFLNLLPAKVYRVRLAPVSRRYTDIVLKGKDLNPDDAINWRMVLYDY